MKIIDLHVHCNGGSPYDCLGDSLHTRDFETVERGYNACGIVAGGFSYFSAVLDNRDIYESNEKLLCRSESDPRIYQWAVIDPRQPRLFDQADALLKRDKVLGIKIHSLYHGYDILEWGDRIFSFANERGAFVLMHNDKISDMVAFADKYPSMKLIIAHLGSMDHIEAIESAAHGNIFTDTSGNKSSLNNIVEYAVERVGSEKIFFGTDGYSCGFQMGRIKYAAISERDKENILYNNAKKHFKRQFSNV